MSGEEELSFSADVTFNRAYFVAFEGRFQWIYISFWSH
jgi:hypothetical protein